MTNEFDNLAADVERVLEEHRSAIETGLGVAAGVVPNPLIDGLLAELDDVVGRLHAAAKPADPTAPGSADASSPADAQPSDAASGPSDAELAAAQAVVDRAPAQ